MTATPARARAAVRAWTVLLTVHLCVLLVTDHWCEGWVHELVMAPLAFKDLWYCTYREFSALKDPGYATRGIPYGTDPVTVP